MTKDQVAEHIQSLFKRCQDLRGEGQKEYAHADNNAFDNFERLAKETDVSREFILWVYLRKHMDGILAWINGHRSQRESVHGRIEDAIVYLALLHAMAEDVERPPANFVPFDPCGTENSNPSSIIPSYYKYLQSLAKFPF